MSTLPPLQLIVCQEGKSEASSEYAKMIHLALRGNLSERNPYVATRSDLAIPYRHFTESPDIDGAKLLNAASHSVVVVLYEKGIWKSNKWSKWLQSISSENDPSMSEHEIICLGIGCLGEQVKDDSSLSSQFTIVGTEDLEDDKTLSFGEHAERSTWFALYVLQACRQILTKDLYNDELISKQKLKLFISHAKKDSLPLANSLRSALKAKKYFSHWYDADDLPLSSDWRQAIREGAENSVVIVIRTEEYDKRPWCRQEFLWAEQCGVPIVAVEARNLLETKADILASQRVPTVRIPDGNLFRVLFIALKESLRILMLESTVKQLSKTNPLFTEASQVKLISCTPTLKHLAHMSDELRLAGEQTNTGKYHMIVHSDPLLSTELYQACKSFIEDRANLRTYITTTSLLPFMRQGSEELYTGSLKSSITKQKQRVNISISESVVDFPRLGINMQTVHDFTVNIAQAIMANEGIVVLGHDWRDDGIMQEMVRFAEEHQDVIINEDDREGMIENHAFWGSKVSLQDHQQKQLKGLIDIVKGEKPSDPILKPYDKLIGGNIPPELFLYTFARSLTVMREQMTADCIARICLGGKDMDPDNPKDAPKGRCPGVVEEAYMSCIVGQPLYISAILGGVSEQITLALDGKEASLKFDLSKAPRDQYSNPENKKHISKEHQLMESEKIIQYFTKFGIKKLSEINHLSSEENRALFNAKTIDEVRQLTLTGLSRHTH